MSEGDFLTALLRLLFDVSYIPAAAAGTLVLVNVVKYLLTQVKVQFNPVLIALAVQVVVFVAFKVITGPLGVADTKFFSWFAAIITMIELLLPVATSALSHAWYEKSRAVKNPILGYKGVPLPKAA